MHLRQVRWFLKLWLKILLDSNTQDIQLLLTKIIHLIEISLNRILFCFSSVYYIPVSRPVHPLPDFEAYNPEEYTDVRKD